MTNLNDRIKDAVGVHLARHRISGRRFGQRALKDPGFVASLERGRRLSLKTADKVLVEMGLPPIGPAFEAEVTAFLEAGGAKPYLLGEQGAGDGSFVARLRRGASFHLTTVEKVRAWMWKHADETAAAAMREAIAGAPFLNGAQAPAEQEEDDIEGKGETGMNEDTHFLSTRKAAAILGLSPRTLDRLRMDGEGPSYHRFGNRILYLLRDLRKWAAAHRVCLDDIEDDDGGNDDGRRPK